MSTLVFFHLLADRHGAPAALLFQQDDAARSAADAGDAAWSVVDVEALRALSAEWPCFYPAPSRRGASGEFSQSMPDANLWSLAVLREGADAHA